jgi:hydroxymethylpyrimidine pyrophosphatase-like HAD family hydrolase
MSQERPKALKAFGVLPDADRVIELGELDGWRPKLVATDLDGTLLDSDGEVSARTRAALELCWDAGIPVVGIAVLAQGGFVVDLERDEVLRTVGLPREQAQAVIERIEAVAGDLVVAVEDASEQSEVSGPLRVQHGFDWPYPEPAHLLPKDEVLPPGAVLKVFLRSSTLGQDELLARAERVVDPSDAEVTHAGLGFIEVLPPGITKATGLAIALERYGVGFGDVLVFGDMPNDLPMIGAVAEAGGRAIAVANAHPAVRAATNGVTSGHDADGVARYLEAVLRDV